MEEFYDQKKQEYLLNGTDVNVFFMSQIDLDVPVRQDEKVIALKPLEIKSVLGCCQYLDVVKDRLITGLGVQHLTEFSCSDDKALKIGEYCQKVIEYNPNACILLEGSPWYHDLRGTYVGNCIGFKSVLECLHINRSDKRFIFFDMREYILGSEQIDEIAEHNMRNKSVRFNYKYKNPQDIFRFLIRPFYDFFDSEEKVFKHIENYFDEDELSILHNYYNDLKTLFNSISVSLFSHDADDSDSPDVVDYSGYADDFTDDDDADMAATRADGADGGADDGADDGADYDDGDYDDGDADYDYDGHADDYDDDAAMAAARADGADDAKFSPEGYYELLRTAWSQVADFFIFLIILNKYDTDEFVVIGGLNHIRNINSILSNHMRVVTPMKEKTGNECVKINYKKMKVQDVIADSILWDIIEQTMKLKRERTGKNKRGTRRTYNSY